MKKRVLVLLLATVLAAGLAVAMRPSPLVIPCAAPIWDTPSTPENWEERIAIQERMMRECGETMKRLK